MNRSTFFTSHPFWRNTMQRKNVTLFASSAVLALTAGSAHAAVISDFSSFNETGNLLTSPNTIEQSFTPSGTSVVVDYVSGSGAGQEYYMSDAFATFGVGSRISLDLDSFTSSSGSETIAIAIGNREDIQNDISSPRIYWGWRPSNSSELVARSSSGSGTTDQSFNTGTTDPDTVFIERTATGWSFGSITSAVTTYHLTDVTSINGTDITTDGTAIGLYSDMRSSNSTWTVSNLDAELVPEPGSLALLGLGGLLIARRRRN